MYAVKYFYEIRYPLNQVDIVNCSCIVRNDFLFLLYISINLLVVNRESVNLIGYITRRLIVNSCE